MTIEVSRGVCGYETDGLCAEPMAAIQGWKKREPERRFFRAVRWGRQRSFCTQIKPEKKANIIANVHLTYTLLKNTNGVFTGENEAKMAEGEGFEPPVHTLS